jgi:hypothetical protein
MKHFIFKNKLYAKHAEKLPTYFTANKITIIALLLLFSTGMVQAQTTEKTTAKTRSVIQFSGVIVERDSLKPVSYAALIVKNTKRGSISDYYGYFSFAAQVSDTIDFSAIGYKKARFIIPDTLSTNRYSLIQLMIPDTVFLQETVIYPWPTKEQFKEAFMSLELGDDNIMRAQKNLNSVYDAAVYENVAMDGAMNYNASMQAIQSKLYYAGQMAPNTLLNPIAWAKFIQAWKRGDFKKKK